MARKAEPNRTLNVSVVGLSGTEKDKGQVGVGKSCICNRFIKPLADDYHVEHISVLSQSDFSGRVVNNDHFLYWGETTKTADDGAEYHFHVIEQTEFIDDASFQPFKGGKMEAYVKRCAATKLSSAEKLMYICKNQLGIEKEYEQKVMPDKVNIDGFICVFDVSMVPSRPIERQVDFLAAVLTNLLKAKKPVVLATTKNDEAFDGFVREAEKLISRKEFKGNVVMVETSSHENVNVDLAFLVLAQIIDKSKNRMRVVPFAEAARARKDILDIATEAFQRLVRAQVTDFRALWTPTMKKLSANQDYIHYTELFGVDSAQKLFRRHVKKLKDEHLGRKIKGYMDMLPQILMQFFPDLPSLGNGDWECIKDKLHDHPDFNLYFLDCPPDMSWAETDLLETTDNRIPFDVLDTGEAELVFRNHVNTLQQEEKIEELRKAFKQLLEETGYVTPGKALSEVQVLFMGRECFEALSESDCQQIYDQHQREISEKARRNFQELLLEHAHLFYQFKTIAPSGTVTQDDIREITEELQEDSRYKALDRLDQERRLLLLQHLGFVHCPRRENCPAYPACMDIIVERLISSKARRPSSWNRNSQWLLSGDSNQLNLVLLGVCGLASQLASEIRSLCEDDEYELENQLYSLDYRIIEGDVNQPQNSFRTADFTPQGCFCVYSNEESFEYIRDSLEKTLLSNLEQEDRLPFQGLPIVILMAADPSLTESQISSLRNEGLSLADNLQCPFIEVSSQSTESNEANQFSSSLISSALRALVLTIQQRAGLLSVCQSSVVESCEPDIRIVMCVLCGDPYSVESVLAPLLTHQCCFLSGENSLTVETFLGDCKRRVEVVVTSYHGADSFRDDLVHGFILVYSTKRKASLATLTAFSQNIPNLPIQVLAVTDIGGTAGAFFSSELSHQLLTAGNAVADRLQSHFMTLTLSGNQKTGIYTPFFKDVWDKKVEIEQAYHMEDSAALDDSGEGTLERPINRAHPLPPPRHESYRIRAGSNEGSGSEIYEKLPTDGSMGDELDDPVSPTFPDDRRLTPSDDSDIYSTLDRPGSGSNPPHQSQQQQQTRKENGEHLVKPSQLKNRHGWLDDSVFIRRNDTQEDTWTSNPADTYAHRAFTTGRRRFPGTQQLPAVPPGTHTPHTARQQQQQQPPGKLNLKDYANVTDAISRMKVSSKELAASGGGAGVAPPLPPPRLAKMKESHAQRGHFGSYDGEYNYTPDVVLPATSTSKSRTARYRREKGKPAKLRDPIYSTHPDDESSLDVSSPREKDTGSPMMGFMNRQREKDSAPAGDRDQSIQRRRDKAKAKEDEKLEKRRQKEEERQRREKEKEKERERKRKTKGSNNAKSAPAPTLEDIVQAEGRSVPLFLEKCVAFIEEEGLDSEGIYRVPGNRAHVDILFQKFDEDPNVNIRDLDIAVNAVATALKDFFSKRLPPVLTPEQMDELEEISMTADRSIRLLNLRGLLRKLSTARFDVLKFIFHHFVRIAENCKANSMDSKNLAICWWPTLLPFEFTDMGRFESMRPHLEDTVQAMIDQFPFLFLGKDEVVMV